VEWAEEPVRLFESTVVVTVVNGKGVLAKVAAALAAAAVEFAWYGLATGIDPWRVAEANLDVSFGLRPAVWVLLAGLATTALRALAKPRRRAVPA